MARYNKLVLFLLEFMQNDNSKWFDQQFLILFFSVTYIFLCRTNCYTYVFVHKHILIINIKKVLSYFLVYRPCCFTIPIYHYNLVFLSLDCRVKIKTYSTSVSILKWERNSKNIQNVHGKIRYFSEEFVGFYFTHVCFSNDK